MKRVLVEDASCCCGVPCDHVRFGVQPVIVDETGSYVISWNLGGFQMVYCCNRGIGACQSQTADTVRYVRNGGQGTGKPDTIPAAFWGEGTWGSGAHFSACVEPFGDETTTLNDPDLNINNLTLPSYIIVTLFTAGVSSGANVACCQYVLPLTFEVDDSDPAMGVAVNISYNWEPCDDNGNWKKAYSEEHDYVPHSCCFTDLINPGEYTNYGCKSNDTRCDQEDDAAVMSLRSMAQTSAMSSNTTTCKWATLTNRQWLGNICSCRVVECRCPVGLDNIDSYGGRMTLRVRYPSENGEAITDADYYEVRSGYCNARYCLNFES